MKKLLLLLVIPALVSITSAQSAEDDIAKLFNTTTTTPVAATNTAATTTPTAAPAATTTDATHAAAEVNLENTSYVNNNNGTYTLSWTPIAGTTKIEISVKNNDLNEDFSTVSKVLASDGKANVTLSNAGNYTVKLLPVDETTWLPVGTEIRKTIKVEWTATPTVNNPTTPDQNTPTPHPDKPKVGAESNMLFGMILMSIIGYMVYRFRKAN